MNGLDYTQQYSQLSNASQPQYSEEFKNLIWFYSLIFMISPIIPLEDFSLLSAFAGCMWYPAARSSDYSKDIAQ